MRTAFSILCLLATLCGLAAGAVRRGGVDCEPVAAKATCCDDASPAKGAEPEPADEEGCRSCTLCAVAPASWLSGPLRSVPAGEGAGAWLLPAEAMGRSMADGGPAVPPPRA